MVTKDLVQNYGWKSECENSCYSAWPHTHELNYKIPLVVCTKCGSDMSFDGQCRQTNLGKNEQILMSIYKCQKCDEFYEQIIQLN